MAMKFLIFYLFTAILPVSFMTAKETKPYGSWESPITGDWITANGVRFGLIEEMGGAIYFSEQRPQEKGRTALVRFKKGNFEELLPLPYNARSRVHEYGGGSVLLDAGLIYFSNDSDQQLYCRNTDGTIAPLTQEKNSRFADGVYDPFHKRLYYVMEVHPDVLKEAKDVENCLVAIDPKNGNVVRIAQGADFYSNPRVSPDGRHLTYMTWNLPDLPWDESKLHVAELSGEGTLLNDRIVAGGKNESVAQPSWGPDGLLYFISDSSGWWNLYREKEGTVEALCPMEAEFCSPQWLFGETSYAFWGDKEIICIYSQLGFDYLASIPLNGGKARPLKIPYLTIDSLSISGDLLYFIGAGPAIAAELIQYDLKTHSWETIKKSREIKIDSAYFSLPIPIEFPTEQGKTAHAFYYPPKNPRYKAPSKELPPLVVMSHGGPTSQASPAFNLTTQYWTSRGFAVVDVNYGGSSGYGRAYRERLNGNWGVVDVDDCVNAALYCVKEKLADKKRLAIQGGSAGGFTTLAALAFRDLFRAGVSYFGVSDLEAFMDFPHKYEAGYFERLVGPYPGEKKLYEERSPLYHADRICCPILFLQGDEDAIVPPSQSEKMYESLLKRKIPTAYIVFQNEQHGFRQAANIKRAIEANAYFYSKIFGISLADKIETVKIDHFDEK